MSYQNNRSHLDTTQFLKICSLDQMHIFKLENYPKIGTKLEGCSFQNCRYDGLELIELGTCGMIYKGYDNAKKTNVAIKVQKPIMDQDKIKSMKKIAQQSKEISFKQVINLYEVFEEQNKIISVMEYANNGNLYNYMQENPKQCQDLKQKIMLQIASGLLELHQLNYLHKDMKPENILVLLDQDKNPSFKICDYYLANQEDMTTTNRIGTPYYLAPELIRDTETKFKYNSEVDIWALGCIYYELITQQNLFHDNRHDKLIKKIKNADQQWIDNQIDQLVKFDIQERQIKLLKLMISVDPKWRPNIFDVVKTLNGSDAFISQIGDFKMQTDQHQLQFINQINYLHMKYQIKIEQRNSLILEYKQFQNQIQAFQKYLNEFPLNNQQIQDEYEKLHTFFQTNLKDVDSIQQQQDLTQLLKNIMTIKNYIKQLNEYTNNIKLKILFQNIQQQINKQMEMNASIKTKNEYEEKLKQQEEQFKLQLEEQEKNLRIQFEEQQYYNMESQQKQIQMLQQKNSEIHLQLQKKNQNNESQIKQQDEIKQLEQLRITWQSVHDEQMSSFIQEFNEFEQKIQVIEQQLNEYGLNDNIKGEFEMLTKQFKSNLKDVSQIRQQQDQTPTLETYAVQQEKIQLRCDNMKKIKMYNKQLNKQIEKITLYIEQVKQQSNINYINLLKDNFLQSKIDCEEEIKSQFKQLNELIDGKIYINKQFQEECQKIKQQYQQQIMALYQFEQFNEYEKFKNQFQAIKLKSQQWKKTFKDMIIQIKKYEAKFQYDNSLKNLSGDI